MAGFNPEQVVDSNPYMLGSSARMQQQAARRVSLAINGKPTAPVRPRGPDPARTKAQPSMGVNPRNPDEAWIIEDGDGPGWVPPPAPQNSTNTAPRARDISAAVNTGNQTLIDQTVTAAAGGTPVTQQMSAPMQPQPSLTRTPPPSAISAAPASPYAASGQKLMAAKTPKPASMSSPSTSTGYSTSSAASPYGAGASKLLGGRKSGGM